MEGTVIAEEVVDIGPNLDLRVRRLVHDGETFIDMRAGMIAPAGHVAYPWGGVRVRARYIAAVIETLRRLVPVEAGGDHGGSE